MAAVTPILVTEQPDGSFRIVSGRIRLTVGLFHFVHEVPVEVRLSGGQTVQGTCELYRGQPRVTLTDGTTGRLNLNLK